MYIIYRTDTADNYEDEDFDEEDYEDDDDNIMGSSKQPAPAKPRKEPPEEDMAGLTAAMQKLATEQPYTPFPNYVSLPAFLGEEVYDFNGHKYINVNFLGLASFGSHNYLFKVVDHGLALECTTLLPPRFYNIERFFDMYHLDINNERSWQDPRIISWMSTVGQVREMYPSMDLIPSYPPMKVVLPEKCDTRIVSQDMLFTSGCNVVYNELANQGNPSPHQLMATCNCRLLATKKQHNANIWTTRATSGAMTPPKQHTHSNLEVPRTHQHQLLMHRHHHMHQYLQHHLHQHHLQLQHQQLLQYLLRLKQLLQYLLLHLKLLLQYLLLELKTQQLLQLLLLPCIGSISNNMLKEVLMVKEWDLVTFHRVFLLSSKGLRIVVVVGMQQQEEQLHNCILVQYRD